MPYWSDTCRDRKNSGINSLRAQKSSYALKHRIQIEDSVLEGKTDKEQAEEANFANMPRDEVRLSTSGLT
ncbi:hypothetical protein BM1_10977 [Bipolaris maydis]|nr:hypothetical protein BM1_10977 [Bipolaris maydis]